MWLELPHRVSERDTPRRMVWQAVYYFAGDAAGLAMISGYSPGLTSLAATPAHGPSPPASVPLLHCMLETRSSNFT